MSAPIDWLFLTGGVKLRLMTRLSFLETDNSRNKYKQWQIHNLWTTKVKNLFKWVPHKWHGLFDTLRIVQERLFWFSFKKKTYMIHTSQFNFKSIKLCTAQYSAISFRTGVIYPDMPLRQTGPLHIRGASKYIHHAALGSLEMKLLLPAVVHETQVWLSWKNTLPGTIHSLNVNRELGRSFATTRA